MGCGVTKRRRASPGSSRHPAQKIREGQIAASVPVESVCVDVLAEQGDFPGAIGDEGAAFIKNGGRIA